MLAGTGLEGGAIYARLDPAAAGARVAYSRATRYPIHDKRLGALGDRPTLRQRSSRSKPESVSAVVLHCSLWMKCGSYLRACVHACSRACAFVCVRARAYGRVRASVCVRAYVYACARARARRQTRTLCAGTSCAAAPACAARWAA
jgi:hypothetical protein